MMTWSPKLAADWLREKGLEPITNTLESIIFNIPGKFPREIAISCRATVKVNVYVNALSVTEEQLPIDTIPGITILAEYHKGHHGKHGNPGIYRTIAKTNSLNPETNNVFRVEVTDISSFAKLYNWYSGNRGFDPKFSHSSPSNTPIPKNTEALVTQKNTSMENLNALLTRVNDSYADIVDITNKDIPTTTKEQLIKARLGQGKFRSDVIKIWGIGECCAVTGTSIKQVLVASHIIPWRESNDTQRLSGTNGILLCSHLDKLFDQHLISFDSEGNLITSSRLSELDWNQLKAIGIHKSLRLNTEKLRPKNAAEVAKNLENHREKFEDS